MIIDGYVECPQCGYVVCVDCYPDKGENKSSDVCDDCGCEFSFNYKLNMDIEDVKLIKKGTNWNDE